LADKKPEARDPLLEERGQTHGDFALNAEISQKLKATVEQSPYYAKIRLEHREALHMIFSKVSRICSGNSEYDDHWNDVAGYAKLAAEACTKK
jgi:hypothetical protein